MIKNSNILFYWAFFMGHTLDWYKISQLSLILTINILNLTNTIADLITSYVMQ